MLDYAVQAGPQEVAAALHHAAVQADDSGDAASRRITANSFKRLQERLRAKSAKPAPPEPVPQESPATSESLPVSTSAEAALQPAPAEPPASPPPAAIVDPVVAEAPAASRDAWEILDEIADGKMPQAGAGAAEPGLVIESGGAADAAPARTAIVDPAEIRLDSLIGSLGEKFGTTVDALFDTQQPAPDDPFSGIEMQAEQPLPAAEAARPDAPVPDAQAAELVRSLLDVMSAGAVGAQPQERTLAADTILRLLPRMPEKSLISLAERVAMMEFPPAMLVGALIRDERTAVAGPLLEAASNLADADLLTVVAEGDVARQKIVARRRHISPALCHALIETMDQSVLLTVLRNPGAEIAHDDFHRLGGLAKLMPALQAPLVTRINTPPPVAFELFWSLPSELRRFVLSRFLTDSETLERILKIAHAVGGGEATDVPVSVNRFPEKSQVDDFINLIVEGNLTKAGQYLAKAGNVCETTAQRIICDLDGEPMAVLLKALGVSRIYFGESLERLQTAAQPMINPARNPMELQGIFDQLSFNKARMLLTYWDWAALQTGPYARNAT